jgi:hypothetical protein
LRNLLGNRWFIFALVLYASASVWLTRLDLSFATPE